MARASDHRDGSTGPSPDDLSLEAEYETDFVAGDIAVSLDEEAHTIEVTFEYSKVRTNWC